VKLFFVESAKKICTQYDNGMAFMEAIPLYRISSNAIELAPGRLNELCCGRQESPLRKIKNTHSPFLKSKEEDYEEISLRFNGCCVLIFGNVDHLFVCLGSRGVLAP
jgi:hypothetical protein